MTTVIKKWSRFVGRLILPSLALAMVSLAVYNVGFAQRNEPPLPPPAEPARSPFANALAGAGVVEPCTESIAVGSQRPGVVEEVFVHVGQQVQRGAPLFRLDDRELKAELEVNKAALAAAEAQYQQLQVQPRPESIPPARAMVREAQARVVETKDIMARARKLNATRSMSAEDLTIREQAYQVALERHAKAEADLALLMAGAWQPDLAVARAAVHQAKARVTHGEVQLERLWTRAPVDGQVLQMNVRPGEFVGAPATRHLILLGNVDALHVRVDVDEHDISRVVAGAPGLAQPRGATAEMLPLRFVRVEPFVIPKKSLTGDNTERVDTRVLQLIYALEPGTNCVYVGQQLDVFIENSPLQPAHVSLSSR